MYYSALLGHPVAQSVSPVLFGLLAEAQQIEYAHLKIDIGQREELFHALQALQTLGFAGANVTVPYKTKVIDYCTTVSPDASQIGAVNTLVFKENQIEGHNTDAEAARAAITYAFRDLVKEDLITVIGLGGVSRAIIFALYRRCPNITILARDIIRAEQFVQHFPLAGKKMHCKQLTQENLLDALISSNILIQTTPVGTHPLPDATLIADEILEQAASKGSFRGKLFFDVVLNPPRTRLLQKAEEHGASICSGLYMSIFQALAAFRLWTHSDVDPGDIEQVYAVLTEKMGTFQQQNRA